MIKPSKIVGTVDNPYLLRWYLIPRNRFFNVYLHRFLRSDQDVPHDHPWWSLSLALWGTAREEITRSWVNGVQLGSERVLRAGNVVVRSPRHRHRMVIDEPFWTLLSLGHLFEDGAFGAPVDALFRGRSLPKSPKMLVLLAVAVEKNYERCSNTYTDGSRLLPNA
ncbi:MAG: hypothetical protein AAFU78_22845 [Cyanobacteria bacterium J06633_2]